MKRLTKFVALFTLAAVCFAVPGLGKITVKAAEPATYVINYDTGLPTGPDWRYMTGSAWSDESENRELYYLLQSIKDGDNIVIENTADPASPLTLNVPVRLGNLTVKSSAKAPVIYAKGYDEIYILNNNTAAINGDVAHAYVYGNATANFNSNVDTLEMLGLGSGLNNLHANIACLGTVNQLIGRDGNDQSVYYTYYNFVANTLQIEDGSLKTNEAYFSKTAPAAAASQPAGQTTQQSTNTTQNAASSAYDDVPKTGESVLPFCLAGAAVLCMVSGYTLRRKSFK